MDWTDVEALVEFMDIEVHPDAMATMDSFGPEMEFFQNIATNTCGDGWNHCRGSQNVQQKCAAHSGTRVGEPVCCGQHGTLSSLQYVCPVEAPYCINYVYGTRWGSCRQSAAQESTVVDGVDPDFVDIAIPDGPDVAADNAASVVVGADDGTSNANVAAGDAAEPGVPDIDGKRLRRLLKELSKTRR